MIAGRVNTCNRGRGEEGRRGRGEEEGEEEGTQSVREKGEGSLELTTEGGNSEIKLSKVPGSKLVYSVESKVVCNEDSKSD